MTDAINGASGIEQILNPQKAASKNRLGQEDFLRLMIAQVQNQDPLDPKTNGDFMAQMAQFSTSDGIQGMQKSLEGLTNSLQSNQALQASAMVGRKVLVNTDLLSLGSEGGVKGAADIPAGVSNLNVSIFDSNNNIVKTFPLDETKQGFQEFEWNGNNESGERMPAGKYTMKLTGQYDNQEVELITYGGANVDSVSLGAQGQDVKLNLAGIGVVSLSEIRQIIG